MDLILFDEAAFTRDSDFDEFIYSVFPTQAARVDSQMPIRGAVGQRKTEQGGKPQSSKLPASAANADFR